MLSYWKLHKTPILLGIGSLLFYAVFAHDLEREDFPKLLSLFAALFFLHYKLIQFEKWNFKFLLVTGILFRLIFLWAEPNLSQDFYRFIWDGELIKNGINPYIHLPKDLISQADLPIANAQELFEGMGGLSARHYSNYPPVNQIIFALASILGGGSILGSVITMRLTIIFADIGILVLGRKLLQNLNRSNHLAFWYFLNPLVIIELTGNLHFEGVMLFFFVWALYLISNKKWLAAAPVYAAAIMVKLVPILFLPLFLRFFGFRKSVGFYLLVAIYCVLLLLPFYSWVFIDNYSETVGLWFSNFEFNAGFYNALKIVAVDCFEAKPWELVKVYGKWVVGAVVLGAMLLALLRKNQTLTALITSMLILLTGYYLLSSTVHPWYLVFLIVLAMFTKFRFAMLWSFLVVLSYFAYSNPDFDENLWLLAFEYLLVIGYLIYEIMGRSGKKLDFFKK
ncbi:polyprenol phosphomannose-dependent alpha 1,6 mannosyltransferase MptB [Flagellimonas algicola]|uniref:Mannosyltransferase n=1 Tax=Flagellimonas algicola TaxID=2583815 RepID=A0ABY2WLN1_9FLAO|nr:polyprenol phosphomannose-dependent alpha 1,6 mannosyltransferase MptB [Allomuricauda algicola]TMU55505.1 mannosyltransferase [Allomuricauda algicola]